MNTIFLLDISSFTRSLILISVVILVLIVILIKIVIITPIKDEIPYKCWHWSHKVLFQVIPGVLLIAVISNLMFICISLMQCKYQWDHGKYQIAEGVLTQLSVEEFWENGATEPSYDCSFYVDDVYFPATNHYSAQEMQELSEVSFVKIYYVYDKGDPWPWRIDKVDGD